MEAGGGDMHCNLSDKIWLCYLTWKDIAIHFFKTGKIIDRDNLSEERLQVCGACEHRKLNYVCSICGCFLRIKTKFIAAKCPIDKW